jgi:very-short-patch-repair endonuclease
LRKHKATCKTYKEKALSGGDIIKCGLCSHTSAKLTQHIKKEHNLTKEFYLENYGELVSPNSKDRYSAVAKENGDWINKAKESGKDLSEFKAKLSKSVSEAIMSNPEERARRAKLLGELNKTKEFRDKASETAKITSARPEIQAARAAQLKRWRDKNPEEFYEKCTSKAFASSKKQTRPEKYFKKFAFEELKVYDFKYSQSLYSEKFINKSKRRQIDFMSEDRKIWIEIDGPLHFKNSFEGYERIVAKDKVVDSIAIDKDKVFIRISFDQWDQKTGIFNVDVRLKIKQILEDNKPGVYCLGKEYGSKNMLNKLGNV